MDGALSLLQTRAAALGLFAALIWAPLSGFPTWPSLSKGRIASTLLASLAVGLFVFLIARTAGAASLR